MPASAWYVHIGESHRGYLGTGSVDFDSFFRALGRIGYDGPIVFESFSSAVVAPDLADMLGIWRNLWADNVDLAAHANAFIRDKLRSVETIALHWNSTSRLVGSAGVWPAYTRPVGDLAADASRRVPPEASDRVAGVRDAAQREQDRRHQLAPSTA